MGVDEVPELPGPAQGAGAARRPAGLGQQLGFDAAATWRPWVTDLQHFTTQAGHFMAEEAPEDIAALALNLMKR